MVPTTSLKLLRDFTRNFSVKKTTRSLLWYDMPPSKKNVLTIFKSRFETSASRLLLNNLFSSKIVQSHSLV